MIIHRGQRVFVEGGGYGGAIARLRLLNILQERCERQGVKVFYDHRLGDPSGIDADLIVGADGVNSALRTRYADEFGTTSWLLGNRLAWYGTRRHFPYPLLAFKKTEHGYFWAAAYAYSECMGTFVAECDLATWERSGFADKSDEERQALTEALFAEELDGHALISNKSQWYSLSVIRSRNWSVGHRVLIGDALHSAHPSIGSGTRIAMEDAIALCEALAAEPDIAGALARFRTTREPGKQKLVSAAEKSFMWYENIAEKLNQLDPATFVFDFMTRTGRVDHARLTAEFPRFMQTYAKQWEEFAIARADGGGGEASSRAETHAQV
jgi:2-polyprenyl-6-methoxyphenol hydroxylase-like FAD-dependent oxidoreductase